MPTLNQRRRETTRLEIAEAALRLFARDGYSQVTADVIAEESGVSLRTFYRYFSSKDDVLKPIVEVRAKRVVVAIAERPADERLTVAVRRAVASLSGPLRTPGPMTPLVRVFTERPDLFRRWLQDLSLWEEPLAPIIQQRLGPTCSEEHARYTACAVVNAMRVAFEDSLAPDAPASFPELLQDVLSYFASGAGLSVEDPS